MTQDRAIQAVRMVQVRCHVSSTDVLTWWIFCHMQVRPIYGHTGEKPVQAKTCHI